jgi:hypothetical protein
MEDSLEILATNGLLNDIEKVNLIQDTEGGVRNENEQVSNQSSHDEDPDSDSEQEVPTKAPISRENLEPV